MGDETANTSRKLQVDNSGWKQPTSSEREWSSSEPHRAAASPQGGEKYGQQPSACLRFDVLLSCPDLVNATCAAVGRARVRLLMTTGKGDGTALVDSKKHYILLQQQERKKGDGCCPEAAKE